MRPSLAMSSFAEDPGHTRVIIDLNAFRHNLSVVRDHVGGDCRVLAVVKANAYGHGIGEISEEAIRCGVAQLGVARIDEGLHLRRQGIDHPILVFEIPAAEHIEKAIAERIDLTVGSVDGAKKINSVAERIGTKATVHIKVDTGMGRLGLQHQDAATKIEGIARCTALQLSGVYSHFATSEDPDAEFAQRQLDLFQRVLYQVERAGIEIPIKHMANSGAIISLPESHLNMVRPGIMLYGYAPRIGMEALRPLKPVMSLRSRVAYLKTVEANTSISYSRRYITKSRATIATIPIGYGDGFSRLLTNKAEVLIRGRRFPVVGTICMDHLMVEVGNEETVVEGDDVTLIGTDERESISAWDIAEAIDSIPYEVTTLIAQRVPRIYVS